MKEQIRQLLAQTPCPDDGELELYAQGGGSVEMRRQVEIHLAECELCRDMVGGMEAWSGESFQTAVAEMKVEGPPMPSKGKMVDFRSSPGAGKMVFWGIAATVSLALAISVLLWKSRSGVQGLVESYGQWEMPQALRGDRMDLDSISEAKSLILDGQHAQAMALLNGLAGAEASYWRALCHHHLGKQGEAREELGRARDAGGLYGRLAAFQIAVLDLESGELEMARTALTLISHDPVHERAEDAGRILAELAE